MDNLNTDNVWGFMNDGNSDLTDVIKASEAIHAVARGLPTKPTKNSFGMMKHGKIAFIPVTGQMTSGLAPELEMMGAGFSPERIASAFNAVQDDNSIDKVLVDARSFGGTVEGAQGMFVAMRELAKVKPVFVFTTALASATYWGLSPATKIFGISSGLYGSIGVAEVISSDKDSTVIRSGSEKLPQVGEITEEGKKSIQKRVMALADVFWRDITSVRSGLTSHEEELRKGGVFIGDSALDKGLVDGIVDSVDQVLGELSSFPLTKGHIVPNSDLQASGSPQQQAPAVSETPIISSAVETEQTLSQQQIQEIRQTAYAEGLRAQASMTQPQQGQTAAPTAPAPTAQVPQQQAAAQTFSDLQPLVLQLQTQVENLRQENLRQKREAIAHRALASASDINYPPPTPEIDHRESLKARLLAAAKNAPDEESATTECAKIVESDRNLRADIQQEKPYNSWTPSAPSSLLASTGGSRVDSYSPSVDYADDDWSFTS